MQLVKIQSQARKTVRGLWRMEFGAETEEEGDYKLTYVVYVAYSIFCLVNLKEGTGVTGHIIFS